jgi:hypothetical protein
MYYLLVPSNQVHELPWKHDNEITVAICRLMHKKCETFGIPMNLELISINEQFKRARPVYHALPSRR